MNENMIAMTHPPAEMGLEEIADCNASEMTEAPNEITAD